MKIAQLHIEFAQNISKFCQIPNEPFQNGQSFVTVCQSGEILPNLVTLPPPYLSPTEPLFNVQL